LKAAVVAARVGGDFWLPDPNWPRRPSLVLAPSGADQIVAMTDHLRQQRRQEEAIWLLPAGLDSAPPGYRLQMPANPWAVATGAGEIWVGCGHELEGVSLLAGAKTMLFEPDGTPNDRGLSDCLDAWMDRSILNWTYHCPFSNSPIPVIEAIRLLDGMRQLIERNRGIEAVLGIARWKRPTVSPMLWDGCTGPRYARDVPTASKPGQSLLAWKSRTPEPLLAKAQSADIPVAEIEDGMIRGQGLGANCIPPLSIVVDKSGIYFDPAGPSDLEQLLESAEFGNGLLRRAASLRQRIVQLGISKYGSCSPAKAKPPSLRSILVVGQVEDDRSILSGGGGHTNLKLLQGARQLAPDAWLIYRPHPDVDAGHRTGHVADDVALRFANDIDRGGSVISLIEAVDEVHCITSLAGFEALLRGKPVTTHGVPFYAGWGLTRDLGPVPERRNRRLSLNELIAATLILYPRYIDPRTGLPCPVEVLVERIATGEGRVSAPLAGVRKIQGGLKVAFRRLREAVA
jgi:capsular polysaccharide export protein